MHKNYNMDPKQSMSAEGHACQPNQLSLALSQHYVYFIILALRRLNLAVKATQPFCTQALVLRNSCILT